MPKIGIIYNDAKPIACRTSEALRGDLVARGCEVYVATGVQGLLGYADPEHFPTRCPFDQLAPPGFDQDMAFAVVLGGDGTVLSAARQLAPQGIPMLAVNTGHMGFLTEIYLNQINAALDQALTEGFTVEDRSMLAVQVYQQETLLWEVLCLNEMVLQREPMTCMCHFEVKIGRHSPVDIAADGIIISTPTGSTAYSLSAGGAVVTPDVRVLQLLPICPHSLASRALIYNDTEPVVIYAASPNTLVMVVDGNGGCYVLPDYRVRVARSPYTARFIRLQSPEFFQILREKLGWGLPHIAKPTSVELP
ncbi:MAG: NAD(+) kinase [Microcoleaceae cyanobacterium]